MSEKEVVKTKGLREMTSENIVLKKDPDGKKVEPLWD